MLRAIGIFFIVLFVYWFDRHNLHFTDTLFSQIQPAKILDYFSKVFHELALAVNK
jgi:hypothetical protein